MRTLSSKIEHYQARAGAIDQEYERRNEDRELTLDDLPYGEELIRMDKAAEVARAASKLLRRLDNGSLQGADAEDAFADALAKVQEAHSTLADCKDLPPDDTEDDFLPVS